MVPRDVSNKSLVSVISNVILDRMKMVGVSRLAGRESLHVILHGVPEGKTRGFCQMPEDEPKGNTGTVVRLIEDCAQTCPVVRCMMFGDGWEDPNIPIVHKLFTAHAPAYR